MNQDQLQEEKLTIKVSFAGCFYAARHIYRQPVRMLMRAVEGDETLSDARIVRFSAVADLPQGLVSYLCKRASDEMPVVNVVTSCFDEKQDTQALADKKVLMWIDRVSPQLSRDKLDQFLGIIVEHPENAELRDVTKAERETYNIPASKVFDIPNAWFRRLDPLRIEHFTICEGRLGLGVELVCRVKAANAPEKRKGSIVSALTDVEVLEPEFKKKGYQFARQLKAKVGIFGIKYKSSHTSFQRQFGGAHEVIQTASPLPLIDAIPAKAAV